MYIQLIINERELGTPRRLLVSELGILPPAVRQSSTSNDGNFGMSRARRKRKSEVQSACFMPMLGHRVHPSL